MEVSLVIYSSFHSIHAPSLKGPPSPFTRAPSRAEGASIDDSLPGFTRKVDRCRVRGLFEIKNMIMTTQIMITNFKIR